MADMLDPGARSALAHHRRKEVRRAKWRAFWTVLATVVFISGLVWYAAYDDARDQDRAEFGQVNRERIVTLEQLIRAQDAQFERCKDVPTEEDPTCAESVVPNEQVEDLTAPTPEVIREIVTPASLRVAVSSFCRDTGECEGEPTDTQLVQAVASYCDPRGECTAEPAPAIEPSPGPSGAPGGTGATGPQGRPPTAEEIAAAVSRFCADGACRGPRGEAAEEIVDIACTGAGIVGLVVTFDSGRTLERECTTVAPPVDPEPDPEPTPTTDAP